MPLISAKLNYQKIQRKTWRTLFTQREQSAGDFDASSRRFKFNKAAACAACVISKLRNNGKASTAAIGGIKCQPAASLHTKLRRVWVCVHNCGGKNVTSAPAAALKPQKRHACAPRPVCDKCRNIQINQHIHMYS